MLRRTLLLISLLTLSAGCPGPQVIPDDDLPHQFAEEATIKIWVLRPDGKWEKVKITAYPYDWHARPQALLKGAAKKANGTQLP